MRKALFILSACAVVGVANAAIIDDFSGNTTFVQTNSANPVDYDSSVAPVVGGTRWLGQTYQFGNKLSAAAIADGILDVQTPSNAVTNTALIYGNVIGDTGSTFFPTPDWWVSFAPSNFSLSGDTIRFNFISNEQNLNIRLVLGSEAGYTFYDKAVAGGQFSPFVVDITAADITSGSPTSLASFDTMYVNFASSPSGDFALDSIETVPEPASMVALGIGALGLLRKRSGK